MILWISLFVGCQEKESDQFSVTNGNNDNTSSSDTDVYEDTGLEEDTDTEEPDTNEPDPEENCDLDDALSNANPLDLDGRADCGYLMYSQSCTGCHGADGTGGGGGIALQGYIENRSDEQMITIIIEGKGGMPPYGQAHPQEIADVVAYMRREFQ